MIYTLYSFKGGVGRSMALANVAAYFCRRGLRVLMIDWDLEAPGLESYFYPADSKPAELAHASARPGLIDLLVDYKKKHPALAMLHPAAGSATPEPITADAIREAEEFAPIAGAFRQKRKAAEPRDAAPARDSRAPIGFGGVLDRAYPTLDAYVQLLPTSSPGELWLLGAGARTPETFAAYADAVQHFDWREFIASYDGKDYLEWLRGRLASFDVVLIDSRTGVTEMGGICTRQMADVVVAFCAPNNQNVDGVDRIVQSLDTSAARTARFNRTLDVLVIPTRVDESEAALLGEFSEVFRMRFEHDNRLPEGLRGLDRPLWNLQIPYTAKYNFRERLVIDPAASPAGAPVRLDRPTEKLVEAYENVALHLAVLAPPDDRVRKALQSEIASAFPQLLPHRPPTMAPSLPDTWIERPGPAAELKEALLRCARMPDGGRLAVWGPAGTGKTTLLARLCADAEIAAAYPDGLVWLTLEGAWGPARVQDFLRAAFAVPRTGGRDALHTALARRRFLFVVDNVWTADQLDAIFEFGQQGARAIVTRDLATATAFADTVVTVGKFTSDESAQLVQLAPESLADLRSDIALSGLIDWPLGASLLRALLDRQPAQVTSPARAVAELRAQLQESAVRLLEQPQTPDRNGSVDSSLRDTISRVSPEARRYLLKLATAGNEGLPVEPNDVATERAPRLTADDHATRGAYRPPARVLLDLGLAVLDGDRLRPDVTVSRWVIAHPELFGGADEQRRRQRKETVKRGYEIVRGASATLPELERIAYAAKDVRAFSLARKLLALARRHADFPDLTPAQRLKILQQHALCTYKDEDLPAEERFPGAREILRAADLNDETPSQETLGLAGTIEKQQWRLNGQRRYLDRSFAYYDRGASAPLAGDFGYTRINAAFVLELIAANEAPEFPAAAEARRRQAAAIREEIVASLPDLAAQPANSWLEKQWWFGATMAESLFALGRYAEARYWLREALTLDPPPWQLESSTRQLASLARAQKVDMSEHSEAWRTLAMLVGDASEALRGMVAGKVGLALSGGGFRASLFHIGVLARLAELDVLRHVDVLSCVSGGSIVGAHYYLEVRRLLQEKRDREITREDYLEIVRRVERDFLEGVRHNLRSRLFAGWLANMRSIFVPGYSRTHYLASLFDRFIYSRVKDGAAGPRQLRHLRIRPLDSPDEFNPKLDNWRRAAKAPILLLNATTLNTGHVWQFAVNWMGEPPISAAGSIDSNDILRRMYYDEAPVGYRDVPLGLAVAASACVPGLFDPVELDRLFPDRRVRLVDGGVHDNQGIAGLLEQECSVVLVSDASGQMNSDRTPSDELVNVFLRTQNISMARIRDAEFKQLQVLQRSSALSALMFLHLKKDLEMKHVDWVDSQDPYDSSANSGGDTRPTTLTTYGMPKGIQTQIAGLRTDLDTFADAEAYALMLSGYRMASAQFPLADLAAPNVPSEPWRFLAVEPVVDRAADYEREHERLKTMLDTGRRLSWKVWYVRPAVALAALVSLLSAVVAAAIAIKALWVASAIQWQPPEIAGRIALTLAAFAAVYLVVLWRTKRKSGTVIATGLVMVTVGWLISRVHLWVFDPIYRRAGSIAAQTTRGGRRDLR